MKKLGNQEKWIIRRTVLCLIIIAVTATPFFLFNELYCVDVLGWDDLTLPLILLFSLLFIHVIVWIKGRIRFHASGIQSTENDSQPE